MIRMLVRITILQQASSTVNEEKEQVDKNTEMLAVSDFLTFRSGGNLRTCPNLNNEARQKNTELKTDNHHWILENHNSLIQFIPDDFVSQFSGTSGARRQLSQKHIASYCVTEDRNRIMEEFVAESNCFCWIFIKTTYLTRKYLARTVLHRVSRLYDRVIIEEIHSLSGVTLACDDWQNVSKESIFGIALVTSSETYVWDAKDGAIKIIKTFNGFTRLTRLLRKAQHETINKVIGLKQSKTTQWNSYYGVITSIVKSEDTLKTMNVMNILVEIFASFAEGLDTLQNNHACLYDIFR
ncbi:hypothetical protein BDC45DRAFT_540745 [Circinella umbellata]|nr:hypothetical protein BDC45DRAFT_540745 [Circinella umbellata]